MTSFAPFAHDLETPRLRLRAWTPADAGSIRGLWAERDPRARHRIDPDGHPTVDEMRVGIASDIATADESTLSLLAIERRDDGVFVGYCGLIVGQASIEEPEIAYELFERYHGRGYATEAAAAVLDAAKATGRSRLWATVRSWNTPSFRVLEKIGFTDSGRIDHDAERGDSIWMTWTA